MHYIRSTYARLLCLMFLFMAMPAMLIAEEAAEVATAATPEGSPWWIQMIYPILMAVALPWLRSYLKGKSDAAKAEAEHHTLSANATLQEQKNFFIDQRLIPFLWAEAEHAVDTRLPEILADATDGDGKFDWKGHLNHLKADLLAAAKDKFADEGMDLLAMIGKPTLDRLVDRAFAKAAPWLPSFLQNEQAKAKASDLAMLGVNKGFTYVREKWLDGGIDRLLGETDVKAATTEPLNEG